jgi:hypothetical protein
MTGPDSHDSTEHHAVDSPCGTPDHDEQPSGPAAAEPPGEKMTIPLHIAEHTSAEPEPGQPDTQPASSADTDGDTSPVSVIWTLFLDSGLSILSYAALRWAGESTYVSLLAATIVAGLRAGYVIARRREVDAFALFMMFVFALGLGLSFVTGSQDFLLVKESFGTGAVGLAFLLTCLFGKPLMYYTSLRFAATTPQERARWQVLWETVPGFRRHFRFLSAVWGVVFLAESIVRIPFVFILPTDVMAVVSPLATPIMITLLLVWTFRRSARYQARARS